MTLTERILSSILAEKKKKNDWRIGVEIENIFYNKDIRRLPANRGEEFSSIDFMEELERCFATEKNPPTLSIEPGGQLEWASAPFKTLFEINEAFQQYNAHVDRIVDREELIQLDFAVEPLFKPNDIELINQNKYHHMHNRFSLTGDMGHWMMRNTASIQINLDYTSLEEAEEMAFIADCLSPIASILFSHAPFWKGKPVGQENLRYRIWDNTDSERCGSLMDFGIVEKKGLLEGVSRLVQMAPAIFIRGTDDELLPFDGPMGKWLQILDDSNVLSDDNIQLSLHQMFTHVRFKKMLELRSTDRPPLGSELAPVAFWVGLLYSDAVRRQVYDIVKAWSKEDRTHLQRLTRQLGLDVDGPENKSIREWIEELCALSFQGLSERQGDQPESEGVFLERYLDTLLKGGSPSIQVQDQYWRRGLPIKEFLLERYAGIF